MNVEELPICYGCNPDPQDQAEFDCITCPVQQYCHAGYSLLLLRPHGLQAVPWWVWATLGFMAGVMARTMLDGGPYIW